MRYFHLFSSFIQGWCIGNIKKINYSLFSKYEKILIDFSPKIVIPLVYTRVNICVWPKSVQLINKVVKQAAFSYRNPIGIGMV